MLFLQKMIYISFIRIFYCYKRINIANDNKKFIENRIFRKNNSLHKKLNYYQKNKSFIKNISTKDIQITFLLTIC